MANIGVVGNRTGWDYEEIKAILELYTNPEDKIISGGARGVDTHAAQFAKKRGMECIVFYPDFSAQAHTIPEAYYARNRAIVDNSDKLLAFNLRGARGGTAYTLRYAHKQGKKVIEFVKPHLSQGAIPELSVAFHDVVEGRFRPDKEWWRNGPA